MSNLKSFSCKQWRLLVSETDGTYEIFNPGPNGEKQFYMVVAGQYGQPLIVAEPTLAFDPPPSDSRYINIKGELVRPDQKITGVICKNGPRGSLTNLKKQGKMPVVNTDGSLSLQIDGETWWITALFLKDKNRILGYDAFCAREGERHGAKVTILELGDLDLF